MDDLMYVRYLGSIPVKYNESVIGTANLFRKGKTAVEAQISLNSGEAAELFTDMFIKDLSIEANP